MSLRRRIACVESSRAEHGHLYWVLKELEARHDVELGLVLTGAHLVPELGYTANEVEQDGFHVWDKVDCTFASDSALAMSLSLAECISGIARALARLRPDMLLLLGDRYEILGAAQVAAQMGIPIAHIHGGEKSEGAVDDSIRHAITKLSHIHFAATEQYAQRIRQMGEAPENVHNFGAPGLEHLKRLDFLKKVELEASLGRAFVNPLLLITFHPVTSYPGESVRQMDALLDALEESAADCCKIFTYPNQDAEGRSLIAKIESFCSRSKNAAAYPSLGFKRYLSLLAMADALVGNSSSGIIESGAFRCPAVNVGPRQDGRMKGPNVIDVPAEKEPIGAAIQKAIAPDFRAALPEKCSPYLGENTAQRIAETLGCCDLAKSKHSKRFVDLT